MSTAAISCGAAATADAGAEILRAGGNAVDAAVAAAFASTVAEPGVSSLGGGGFLLVREPAGTSALLDFFTSVPAGPMGAVETVTVQYAGTTQDFHVGPQTVAVPGCLDGFLEAHRRWGRLPVADVIAPAVGYARDGVVLDAGAAHAMELIAPVLLLTPQIRSRMARRGHLLRVGETFIDPELADLLVAVGEGLTGADLAGRYAAPVMPADVREYEVVTREPLIRRIRGATLITNPPPSLGGSIVAHVLGDLRGQEHPRPVELAGALVETTAWLKGQTSAPVSTTGTTHISVIDGDGMCAAMTVSNGLGSGVMLPGTGIHLNNMMGEDDLHPAGAQAAHAGERIRSMMAPSIVEFDDGVVALGTGGSARIRSALARVITLLTGHDADLAHAIDAPRLHVDEDAVVQVEPGLSIEGLAPVNQWPERHFYFGGVNGVQRTADGEVRAHADPRRGGACRVLDVG